MKKATLLPLIVLIFTTAFAHADVVILRDGKSYSGTYTGAASGKLAFQDDQGIQYTFPLIDVQSLVFANTGDHISLRNGQSYSGQMMGATTIAFQGSNGVSYVFPLSDVSSLVITGGSSGTPSGSSAIPSGSSAIPGGPSTQAGTQVPAGTQYTPQVQTRRFAAPAIASNSIPSVVIAMGTQISVRTDTAIDSTQDAAGKLYPARINQDVMDSSGAVALPAGTSAQLQLVDMNKGGAAKSQNLILDLYSVDLNGTQYRVDTSSVTENGKSGLGMNRRTAEFTGGGAVLGALLGAAFGGGRGAGIGALAGGGGGALTQLFTHGKQVQVPAETILSFQLTQTLVLHP